MKIFQVLEFNQFNTGSVHQMFQAATGLRERGHEVAILSRPDATLESKAREQGVADRLEGRAGDMFRDPVPERCDVVLLSNVLHDWDVPECRKLLRRCADALPPGGRLLIHDVFLNDDLDGPLPIALYSASLFALTEGRAYSGAEYKQWLTEAGLKAGQIIHTLVHCGLLAGQNP